MLFALLYSLTPQAAQTFATPPQFPTKEVTFTVDAAIAYEVEKVTAPDGAFKCSVYFETNAGRISFDQALTDGSSTLSATTGIPVPADTWFDIDMGKGDKNRSDNDMDFFVASATVSTRVYVICMGRSEP